MGWNYKEPSFGTLTGPKVRHFLDGFFSRNAPHDEAFEDLVEGGKFFFFWLLKIRALFCCKKTWVFGR